jgi:O-antigen/teichoic acid export membrane protein
MRRAKQFVLNALVLTGASLLMRTVSVSYNAWMSNRVGAEAMGLLSLIMSVNVFAVTFATSGINLGCTRLVSEAIGHKNVGAVRGAVCRCVIYSLIFGSAACSLILSLSHFLAFKVIADARALVPLRLLAVSLVPLSMSSALSGYFTAVRHASKNAVSQIFEQGVRVLACSMGLSFLAPAGVEYACIAIVAGGSLAELCSFALTFILYIFDSRRNFQSRNGDKRGMTGQLLKISLPVAVSAYARSGLVSLEHLLIPIGLEKSGLTRSAALSSYGILNSMVLPIVLYPAAITSAFASLLVPEMAENRASGNEKRIGEIAGRVIWITLAFSLGCAAVLCTLSNEFGRVIYNNDEAGKFIRLIAVLVPVMYLDGAVDAMLKGLGQQVYCMGVNITDALLSVILVWTLLPIEGIYGYVIVIYITELINDILSLYRLICVVDIKISILKKVIGPIAAAVSAGIASRLLYDIFPGFYCTPMSLVTHCVVMLVVYVILLFMFRSLDREDCRYFKAIFE